MRLTACVKGACVAGIGTATVLALGFGIEKLLEKQGYPPVFKQTVKN